MSAFLTVENVSRLFGPNLSTGEKIAAKLGAKVETRSVRAVSDVRMLPCRSTREKPWGWSASLVAASLHLVA